MSSGCGDILSLEDLKTAKKHQTFEAEVITGHEGGTAAGASITEATNPVTGQVQETLPKVFSDMQSEFNSDQAFRENEFNADQAYRESEFIATQADKESRFVNSQTDKENRFVQFLLSSGYVFLGDYESGPLQFTERNQYTRFDGQYYRLNAATAVGFTTTGTDATSFANDVAHLVLMDGDVLRQELAQPDGVKLVGGIGYVTPEMFGYLHGVSPDVVPFAQAAIDYGRDHKLPVNMSGDYWCVSAPQSCPLPADDGTAYPAWVTSGADVNLPPEEVFYQKAHLRLYNNSVIIGSGRHITQLFSTWSRDPSKVNNYAPAMFYIEGDNGNDGTVTYTLKGIRAVDCFIGRIVRGISYRSEEDDMEFRNVGISGIIQGEEQCVYGNTIITGYAGETTGGWWLQRNNSTSSAYIPPYPSTDVYRTGWCDGSVHEFLSYGGFDYVGNNSDMHNAIDNYFDQYFFKSRNTPKTSLGGRLTNSNANTRAIKPLRGISGRARSIYTRYARENGFNVVAELKTLRTIRAPVYMDSISTSCYVGNAYIESVGLINNSAGAVSGNYFGIDVADPWGADTNIWGVEGGGLINRQTAIFLRPGKPCAVPDVVTGAGTIHESWNTGSVPYRMGAYREWNPATKVQTYIYDFKTDTAKMRPTHYYDGGPDFSYTQGSATPRFFLGGTELTPTVAKMNWYTLGKNIRCVIYFNFSTLTVTGPLPITTLAPGFNGAWDVVGQGIGKAYLSSITDGTVITPVIASSNNSINLNIGSGSTRYNIPVGTYNDLTLIINLEYIQP